MSIRGSFKGLGSLTKTPYNDQLVNELEAAAFDAVLGLTLTIA
jgi:hypothetical protein